MFIRVIGCFISAFIIIFFSIDTACPFEVEKSFGVDTPSFENKLTRGVMMAGLFAPSKPNTRKTRQSQPPEQQPAEPQPEVPSVSPVEPDVTPPQPETVQPAPSPVPATPTPQPETVQPAPPPVPLTPMPQPETAQPAPPPPPPAPAPAAPTAQPAQPPAPAAAQPVRPRAPMALAAKRGDVSFNFDDADVYSVIQTIFGDVLRVNYIIDPRVKGRVNFRSVAPVAKEDVLPLMEVILRLNGIGVVEEGGLYRIVPISELPKEPAPIGMGRDAGEVVVTGKARLQVVPVKYIQSTEMTRILTPFLSTSAVIVDVPKSNHIVIVDTDANVKRLLQLVETFDNEELKEVTPKVFVYAVQNSKAKDVAALLQQIFQKGGAPAAPRTTTTGTTTTTQRPPIPGQPATPAAPSPQVSLGGQYTGETLVAENTRIIADEVTNSVIVLATPEDYAIIYDTIQKIDIMPRQVVLEGLVVQVTLTDNLSFGLAYSLNTDFKITGLKPFKNPIDLRGPVQTNPGLFNVTGDKSSIPSAGFSFIGSDPSGNIRAVLTALEDQSKAKVVAAPHILVADNREARIQVGQQIPLATSTSSQITGTTTVTATSTPVIGTTTVQYKDIGIILKVKPQVNDSGLISLELSQEISAVGSTVTVGGLDEISINKTEVSSNLVARDGETIVIGGLIREDTTHGRSGIPFLSRIPFLGALFGNTKNDNQRNEIIILLTPHVMRNQEEAKGVTSGYVDRFKGVTKDKEIDRFIKDGGQKQEPEKEQPVEPVPSSVN